MGIGLSQDAVIYGYKDIGQNALEDGFGWRDIGDG